MRVKITHKTDGRLQTLDMDHIARKGDRMYVKHESYSVIGVIWHVGERALRSVELIVEETSE